MGRILGLDVGDKWIGVAVSDDLLMMAQPVCTLERVSNKKTYEEIYEMILEYKVDTVVVGLPKNMNNTIGPQAEKVVKFSEKLKNKYKVEIVYIDERMTTLSAERVLIEGNVRRENRKKYVDKIAATYILQTHLDILRRNNA
ncbi:Holliday junction resolvase RuvX [Peptoniphilus asaccharolyticus]